MKFSTLGFWGGDQLVDQRLTPSEHEVLKGRYLLDESDVEIAKCLNCKPSAVRSRIYRAKARLKAAWQTFRRQHNR